VNVPEEGAARGAASPDDGSSRPTSTGVTLERSLLESSHGFAPGTVLAARFRIVSLLGRGGMGEVYRAEDLKLGQAVALKFLPGPIDQAKLKRFYGEVRLGRQVAHPNVCRIYDVIEAEGRHFLVMEYVDGEDLASLLRRIGRLPQDKGLEIARGLCAGLAAAHVKGILHRDLKPANVMIDGRGQARITDFGLAALAGETPKDERAGTPAYMAPEQLRGDEVSVRTDLYSLGLVLYEVFTGRRAWDAGSLAELVKRRSDSSPTSPSSLVPDLDRAVERVIMSCLAREPSARPATSLAALAALPGGDPLEAAIALGETPAPEMVAAAAVVGDLSARAAWAWLGAALLALAGVLGLSGRVMLHRIVPLPKSAEVLLDRAKTIAGRLAPGETVVDSAWGFEVDQETVRDVANRDRSPGRWRRLAIERPGPFRFWYRASREPLVARTWVRRGPFSLGPRPMGRVTRQEPPPTLAGMQEVVLDTSGRLLRWQRVPAGGDSRGAEIQAALGWLFTEAGLEEAALTREASSGRAAEEDVMVWGGAFPDAPGRLRVEARFRDGGVALFEVAREGATPAPTTSTRATFDTTPALGAALLVAAAFMVGVFALAIRNLRLKRGDRRGAFRFALFGAVTGSVALKLGIHFSPSLRDALDLSLMSDAQAVYWAVVGWTFYIALEPAIRRTWPHMLISWSRLLSGRLRDPLVGRDVLLGVTAGLLFTCLDLGCDVVPVSLAPTPWAVAMPALASSREALSVLLQQSYFSPLRAAGNLLMLLLAFRLTRSKWMALSLLWLFWSTVNSAGSEDVLDQALVWLLVAPLVVGVLFRLGLLSAAVMFYVAAVLPRLPLTTDWTAWYAGASVLGLAVVGGLAVYGFLVSLAGKPLLGRPVIDV